MSDDVTGVDLVAGSGILIGKSVVAGKRGNLSRYQISSSGGVAPSGPAGGDLGGTYPNPVLAPAGPGATGPVGAPATIPVITIDAKGRVTALSSAAVAPFAPADGSLAPAKLTPGSPGALLYTGAGPAAAWTDPLRFKIDPNGRFDWGSGAALDTALYRSGANNLAISGSLITLGPHTSDSAGSPVKTGDVGGGAGAGIVFGAFADAKLYRSASATLKTDSALISLGGFSTLAADADTQPTFRANPNGRLEWGPGGSTAVDTTLYRSGAGVLKTDGQFIANAGSANFVHIYTDGGIYWNDDSLIYRLAAQQLHTNSRFSSDKLLIADNGLASQMIVGDVGGGLAGLRFGNAQDTNLYRSGAGALKTDGSLVAGGGLQSTNMGVGYLFNPAALSGSYPMGVTVVGDAGWRFLMNTNGDHYWGPGTPAATDTNLYRNGANALQTDGAFTAGGVITGTSNIAANAGAAGQILLNSNAAIYFGSAADTYIYRSQAATLTTNGNLVVGVNMLSVGDAYGQFGTAYQVRVGNVAGYAGLLFGSAQDTNLYRAAANSLQTDDNFTSSLNIFATSFYATAQVRATGAVVAYDGTANQVGVGTPAGGAAGPGLSFGSANDTNIYRSAADILKTDDSFFVGAHLLVQNQVAAAVGGSNIAKLPIYNASNVLIGYIPIYAS